MARQANKLTAIQVNKLTKAGLYGDGGNLWLQITPAGVKSWLFRYMINGKPQALGLGPLHTVSLKEARNLSLLNRQLLQKGCNPLSIKHEERIAAKLANARKFTFDQCSDAYINAHKASWKNQKHASQWANTLKAYASPVFGHLPVSDIDTNLIVRCLSPIWESKNETASRVRGRIESILSWATTSGYRTGENPARWKGHLKNLLATIKKTENDKHHASLPWVRATEFMSALRERTGIAARALEFTILTACRSGNIREVLWSEIDLEKRIWKIPPDKIKMKKGLEVPLSSAAINILASTPKLGALVFPGTKGQPLSDSALSAVIKRMNKNVITWVDPNDNNAPITVHGFRTTFRMWAAEATDYPREVAEHALAHQLPDAVERAYQRGTQFPKRIALMEDWATYCCPN